MKEEAVKINQNYVFQYTILQFKIRTNILIQREIPSLKGWIRKSSLLITKKYGPRVRLSTILTDFPFEPAIPIEKTFCGKCTKCIDACPANAITGRKWYPGLARKNLVDVCKCDNWKKTNYFDLCKGHVCGICMAVCHFGRKAISRT